MTGLFLSQLGGGFCVRLAHKSLLWVFLRQWMIAFYNSLDFALSVEVDFLLEENALIES